MKTANRHEFALLKAYGKEMYTLLDSGGIPNIVSRSLADRLHLSPLTTSRRIQGVAGHVEGKLGVVEDVPVDFDGAIVPINFLVSSDCLYNFIIGLPTLKKLKARMDFYRGVVKMKYGREEVKMNLGQEPRDNGSTEDEDFTSATETESGSESDHGDAD